MKLTKSLLFFLVFLGSFIKILSRKIKKSKRSYNLHLKRKSHLRLDALPIFAHALAYEGKEYKLSNFFKK
jgi:hypothetical protein